MGYRIAVLSTCHNRRDKTLTCLRSLCLSVEKVNDADVTVFLVDDGSTDGTASAVVNEFPDVRVVKGDGTLYWARGMRKAWEAAVEERDDWDGYLWLNDDTELRADAIAKMLAANDGEKIVVGELESAEGKIVYGSRPGGLFTGNCVFVSRKVYERLGMICGDYFHAWADSDYAMMAKRAGIGVVSAGVVGKAEGHPNRPSLKGLSLRERIAMLRNPKGWNLHDLWLYRRRNWWCCVAIVSCAHMLCHVLCGGDAKKTALHCVPWLAIWLGYCTFGLWIRSAYEVDVGRFQIHGYDYSDYAWFLSDWREILYPRPRHPLWGVMTFPLVVVCNGVKVVSPALCLSILNAVFAAVMTCCVWMVTMVIKCGWSAGLLYACFSSSLLLGGMPESFGVSSLLALVAVHWFSSDRMENSCWIVLGVVSGGVTVTQGVKVFLLRYVFNSVEALRTRVGRVVKLCMYVLGIALLTGLAFILIWWTRKLSNPEYSRTLMDMVHDLTVEFSNSDFAWEERLNRWWVFLSEPILTRGTSFDDTGIWVGYSNRFAPFLLIPIIAMAVAGIWVGRKTNLVKALLVFLSVDVFIHFVCGWGMREPHLYAGHWTFALPILCSVSIAGIRSATAKRAFRAAITCLSLSIMLCNLRAIGVI